MQKVNIKFHKTKHMKTNEKLLIDKSSSIILFNSELYQHELIRSQITYFLTDKLVRSSIEPLVLIT